MEQTPHFKTYQKIRNWLTLGSLIYSFLILLSAVRLSSAFYEWSSHVSSNRFVLMLVYFFLFSAYSTLCSLPLSFYSGFILEHQFHLSNQIVLLWIWDWLKKQVLSFTLGCFLISIFYWIVWNRPLDWWFLTWFGYLIMSFVLGKLFPLLIIPLFYKYGEVSNQEIRNRIEKLASRFGFPVKNIFSINLSKTTKKANAMFVGFGRSRRIVLSDTLIQSFSPSEIETVVAHELGHERHKDIWKHLGFSAVLSFLFFWFTYYFLEPYLSAVGFEGVRDIRALPTLSLFLFAFQLILLPLSSTFSRKLERHADQFALESTQMHSDFVSALKKLGNLNLADPKPHPLVEFVLYDHPAIGKRIRMAEEFGLKGR